MPAYIAVEITIHDPVVYEKYKALAPAGIAKRGGKYLVRFDQDAADRRAGVRPAKG